MNLNQLTIKQASEGIQKKKFSIKELAFDCCAAVEKQKNLKAFLSTFDDILAEAEKLDNLDERFNTSPLFGIPLAIKDNILIENKPSTAGSKILENYTAAYDATVIRKLRGVGALFMGKTNMDEFACGSSTENSAFGPTLNPHDTSRVPGGSSGGSAAAVAAHLSLGALGSDTGGSIRQPASFSGVVGFKPTYGRVSRHGLIAMASSLDQIGPFAKTVEDTHIIFDVIKGQDDFDATSVSYDLQSTIYNLENVRIGLPKEYFSGALDADIKERILEITKELERKGAIIKEISLPNSSHALPTYYIIVPSEVSANLARFDGIRYGFQDPQAKNLSEIYTKSRAHGFGNEIKRRIMLGTYALSAGYYNAYYLKAQKVRRLIASDFDTAFSEVDFILGPTTPSPAFALGEKSSDPLAMYLADIYTVAVNLAGLPGLSVPAGLVTRDQSKLPFGLQIIGPRLSDEKVLSFGEYTEQVIK